MPIRPKMLSVAFLALMLPYVSPSLVESKAVAQVSKQSRASADQQAIIQAYRTMKDGLWNRNINQAFSVCSPKFTNVMPNKEVKNLEQIRSEWQQAIPKLFQIILSYRSGQIQINGTTATVLGIEDLYQNFPDPQKNSPHAYSSVTTVTQFQDTWKRTPSGWKLTNRRTLQQNASRSKPQGPGLIPTLPSESPNFTISPVAPR